MQKLRVAMEPVTGGISVVIPALNEEATIGDLVREMPWHAIAECIVVDNGSTDATAARAREAGARVVHEPRRGYGRACHSGYLQTCADSAVVVFMDGDGSDVPAEIPMLVRPIAEGRYDFVIATRIKGTREPGALLASQVFAGWLAGTAMRWLYGVRYTDMGPLRAISRTALESLEMQEMTYGWNLEMQMKAARVGLRILEVPGTCRCRRGGVSKVAGSVRGSVKAATRILEVLLRIGLRRDVAARSQAR